MKKLLTMCIALVLVFSLVACGTGSNNSETPKTPETPETPDQPADSSQPEDDGEFTVGFCPMDLSNNFWAAIANSFEAAGKEAGVKTIVTDGKSDAATQVAALEDYISQQIDVIVVGPVDSDSLKGVIAEAKEAGIPVITHTTHYEDATCNMNVDEFQMGFANGNAAGEWMAKNYGEDTTAKFAILTQRSLEQTIGRENGIQAGIKEHCPNAVLATTVDAHTTDLGITAGENILTAHPDVVAILGINDSGALGAYEAANAQGITDPSKFFIGGNDGTEQALELISSGTIYQASVYLNPVGTGKQFIDYALALKKGESIPESFMIPVSAITPENVAEYKN
jgi:ribose transport system substrate-binding protein